MVRSNEAPIWHCVAMSKLLTSPSSFSSEFIVVFSICFLRSFYMGALAHTHTHATTATINNHGSHFFLSPIFGISFYTIGHFIINVASFSDLFAVLERDRSCLCVCCVYARPSSRSLNTTTITRLFIYFIVSTNAGRHKTCLLRFKRARSRIRLFFIRFLFL